MADKYLYNNGGTITEKSAITTSAGAGDSGKIPALDGAGKLDATFMPTGFGDEVVSIVASENLSAGDFVNIWNDGGTAKARKADATSVGKEAYGFVLSSVTAPAAVSVYFEGANTSVTGQTPGVAFLATTAGQSTATAPSGSGNVVQRLGIATSATSITFEAGQPIVLA